MHYNTHVFAVVRVGVSNTNCADEPEMVAKDVSEAVANSPEQWMIPKLGHIDIEGAGSFEVSSVEFASEVNWTVVDELDKKDGELIREHHFDVTGESMLGRPGFITAREARLDAEVERLRNQLAALTGTQKEKPQSKDPSNDDVMNKDVSVRDLAEIVDNLLRNPAEVGELDDTRTYQSFLTAVAQAVCDHCGGEIASTPSEENNWRIGIRGNDSLPEGSEGIWQYGYQPI